MGEVYRARDARLGRDVALKVLPPDVARDPERRLRFEQEARAASALNHPHIVTVYDIGAWESTLYIAMELVDGRTLREILASGPLPTRRLLDLAIQAADGLAKAHDVGIVHRDLKPENLMVTRDGHLKILDFGLAKLSAQVSGDADHSTSPKLTRSGMVIGTVGYMSPEQASGTPVDFRSDQFSLGSILYEMASGKKAFERKTGPETLAAIIRDEPEPLARLSPGISAPLLWAIEQCLEKDADERYAATADLARDLRDVREHLSEAPAAGLSPARLPPRYGWASVAIAALVVLACAVLLGRRAGTSPSPGASFHRLTFLRGTIPTARFAPDGQTILYGASWEGRPLEVFSTRTDSPESHSLGLPKGDVLAISSSGEVALSIGRHRVVGWETSGTLARVPLAGGAPREILEDVHDADWTPDGKALAVVRDVEGRRRLECPIGKVLYETAGWIGHPRVSPKGDFIAFLDHPIRNDDAGSVAVVDVGGKKRTLSEGWGATQGLSWSPKGDEVWFTAVRTGTDYALHAVPLSGKERVILRVPGAVHLKDIAGDGRILFSRYGQGRETIGLSPGRIGERSLAWFDSSYPKDLSDDGRTLVFEEQGVGATGEGVYGIYLRGTDGAPAVRLGEGIGAALSPDGKRVVVVQRGPSGAQRVLLPTGAGQARPVSSVGLPVSWENWCHWLPDGDRIIATGNEPGRRSRLYVQGVSEATPHAVTPEGVGVNYGNPISPDGKLVAARGPDGRTWLYPLGGGEARPVPGLSSADIVIRWTADARSLYTHRSFEVPAQVSVVEVTTGLRKPWKDLAPTDPAGVSFIRPILLSRDGASYVYAYSRFLDDLYVVEGLR